MKKALLASAITLSLTVCAFPPSGNVSTAQAPSQTASLHTYASYYSQGYSNALMGLHTYVQDGSAPWHIAHIMNHAGKSLNFSFSGEADFVDGFGASDDCVLITGPEDAYAVTVSQAALSGDSATVDAAAFSAFLTPTQSLTDGKITAARSADGQALILLAEISDENNWKQQKGYLGLLLHNATLQGLRISYMMPASAYKKQEALSFITSLSFGDQAFEDALNDTDAAAFADDYESYSALEVLCDTSHFAYRALPSESFDKARQLIRPSLVELFHADSENSKNGWSGSGVIYDIEPDYIYFLTVAHVADFMTEGSNELWFFDGTRITFESRLEYTRLSDENEISLFRLPVSMVPMRVLINLREATVSHDFYASAKPGQQLLSVATNYRHTKTELTTPMTLLKIGDTVPENRNAPVYLSGTLALQEGMSGTAVIDMLGNLVGIADARNMNTGKSYALMIDQLSTFNPLIS